MADALHGAHVLITGGGSGIGRALALAFAAAGVRQVTLADVNAAAAAETATAVRAHGVGAAAESVDVTRYDQLVSLRDRLTARVGGVDVLVNNAGTVHGGAFADVSFAAHARTHAVNLLGLVAATHVFLPQLLERPHPRLVNVASAAAFVPLPFGATYASSKWAVVGFSESLRLELRELGHRHLRVTTVCPGYVDTGLFAGAAPPAMTPPLAPAELAARVVSATRRGQRFVKAPWTVHVASVARGLLPGGLYDLFVRAFGVHRSMRTWRGRTRAPSS